MLRGTKDNILGREWLFPSAMNNYIVRCQWELDGNSKRLGCLSYKKLGKGQRIGDLLS
jgi:hypothetical protein